MKPEGSQYWLIDGLKVLAAQMIVLHHCVSYGQLALATSLQLPSLSSVLFDYGRYAVQVFLVMAGYLAAQSAEKAFAISHAHSKGGDLDW